MGRGVAGQTVGVWVVGRGIQDGRRPGFLVFPRPTTRSPTRLPQGQGGPMGAGEGGDDLG